MIKNINNNMINDNSDIAKNFLNAKSKNLNINCNILNGNFYSDSFNYFPILENKFTFEGLFKRDENYSYQHYYSENFYKNFTERKNGFKKFENVYLLGSNVADNFYSNMIHFLPRLFFNEQNDIKVAIHRNLSNKFRKLIDRIYDVRKIKYKFVYLDDDFYYFSNSRIPQFLKLENSVNILKNFLLPIDEKGEEKIYVTREDSEYRKIVNEADLISFLISKGYKVINPRLYEIDEQIKIFSQAKKIISTHGSNLTNIIFCKPETEIIEIAPNLDKDISKNFKNRYQKLANLNKLKYQRIIADPVEIVDHSKLATKYINKNYLENSNYYKNIIINLKKFKSLNFFNN
tara:strand:- start:201 stop:1238 length:1038 start_codon:yes stop_codon:yes gene_type:complete